MLLKAHRVAPSEGLKVEPAHPQRGWMNETLKPFRPGQEPDGKGFANRCLPLLMANQLGWHVKTTYPWYVSVGATQEVEVQSPIQATPALYPQHNFGHNIVTWPMPWVFETPEGWDLWITPPTNYPLPGGATCLSGIVETDHAHQTFTLNWKLRPMSNIFIPEGTPLATLLPLPTSLLEAWHLQEDDEVPEGYPNFLERRNESIDREHAEFGRWDKDYWNDAKRRKIERGKDESVLSEPSDSGNQGCPVNPG